MTYKVFGGMLSLNQSINHCHSLLTGYLLDLRTKVGAMMLYCSEAGSSFFGMEQSSYQHHSINLFAIFQETT